MGFNIFASGTGKFHYQRDGFIDGDTFAPMKVVSELMTMSPNKEGVITTVIVHSERSAAAARMRDAARPGRMAATFTSASAPRAVNVIAIPTWCSRLGIP